MKNPGADILFYSDTLSSFDYGAGHPFKPARAKYFYELLNRFSLINEPGQMVLAPRKIDEELLLSFHTPEYIELLKRCDRGEYDLDMLRAGIGTGDNPVIRGMFEYSLLASGATHQGAMMLLENEARFVFNPHGGFHHAGMDTAEGFCYINDIAIAITSLLSHGKKVAYVDLDAHHGNGVQDAFYSDRRALTISLHETGKSLYPWTGFENETGTGEGEGFNVNLPFSPGTDDETYLASFHRIVPPLITAFAPDVIFIEVGGDAHMDDPLTHMNLTSAAYKDSLGALKELCPRIIATGGGGYNVHKTAALWALAWATLCGIKPVDAFAGLVGGMMYGPEAQMGTLDDPPYSAAAADKKECRADAERVAEFIEKNIFPLHGIRAES